MHGELYATEHGYIMDFEAYVAKTVSGYPRPLELRERLWIVEKAGAVRGSIAIMKSSEKEAQLRWLLLPPTFGDMESAGLLSKGPSPSAAIRGTPR